MIKKECGKTFSFPILILILFLCSLNLFLRYFEEVRGTAWLRNNGYVRQWEQVKENLEQSDGFAVYEQLQRQYEDNWVVLMDGSGSMTEVLVTQRILREMESSLNYEEYLQSVIARAGEDGVFDVFKNSESNFIKENRALTAQVYEKLDADGIQLEPSLGVELFAVCGTTDLIVLFLLFFLQVLIWGRDREIGMDRLLHACCRGRAHLASARIGVTFLSCAGITLLFYGGNLLLGNELYGIGDPGRSLASVYLFRQTGWRIWVWQFILLFFCCKLLVLFLWGLLFGLAVEIAGGAVGGAMISLGGLAVFLALYEYGSGGVRYLTPWGLLRTENLFSIYRNLNFFDHPVEYVRTAFGVTIIIVTAAAFLLVFRYRGALLAGSGKAFWRNNTLAAEWLSKAGRGKYTTNLFVQEVRKWLISEKVILIVMLLFFAQLLVRPGGKMLYYDETQYYYSRYMQYLSGELTPEKEQYLREEKEKYERLLIESAQGQESMRISQELEPYTAFLLVQDYVAYIEEQELGFLVYEDAFGEVIAAGSCREDALLACEAMFFVLLCSALLFGKDDQLAMGRFCRCTLHGRRRAPLLRMLLGAVGDFLILLVVYVSYFWGVAQNNDWKWSYLQIPAGCLRNLSAYGDDLTLGGYFVLLFLVRYLFMNLVTVLVCLISRRLKSLTGTVIAGGVLFVLPFGLLALNDSFVSIFWMFAPMLGNALLSSAWLVVIGSAALLLILTGVVEALFVV